MNRKINIGLIDGLPFRTCNTVRVMAIPEIKYPWDSELFGVPDYRAHADEMIALIRNENLASEIMLFPFYPKFNSVRKNYALIAKNLEQAIDSKCHIICICLEVLDANYLSSDMLRAYKHAHERGVVICVSAGNHRPFQNPLIHKKYTIPIVGMDQNTLLNEHPRYEKSKNHNGFAVCSNDLNSRDKKTSCSTATAIFVGYLSNLFKNKTLTNNVVELENLIKEPSHETNHRITFFNAKLPDNERTNFRKTSEPNRTRHPI